GRHRDPPGPDPELDDRPAGPLCLAHVERDVLGDADAPRVVDAGDRVVRARAQSGRRGTHPYPRDWSSKGARSKSPYRASTSSPETSISPSHSFFVAHHSEEVPPASSVMSIRLSPTA